MKNLLKLIVVIFVLSLLSNISPAAAGETKTKSFANSDKAEAVAEEVLQKIKDETLTDEEKEKMLDKLKKLIEKSDNAINKKRLEIQKIEEEIKPIEAQKASLNEALDELISYVPKAFNAQTDDKDAGDKKGKKDKKDKKDKNKDKKK